MENENFYISSKYYTLSKIQSFMITLIVIFFSTFFFIKYSYKLFKGTDFYKAALNLSNNTPSIVYTILIGSIIFIAILCLLLYEILLKPPKYDRWIIDIAKKRLSSEYILYDKNNLCINFDVSLKKKDLITFVQEISNKSNKYSYYLTNINIDERIIIINTSKKKNIPLKCSINKEKDKCWNIIPLGECVNNELKNITPIGWCLNDTIKEENILPTLPSTSLVIAGGTGSGKSVVENGIIGHITRFPDKIQGLLVDVKKVEFGGLEEYKGIKKVGLTILECREILEQAKEIMYDRFTFMEKNKVNNIYKLDSEVNYYEINEISYQFDEIFNVSIDGNNKLLTIDKIYDIFKESNFESEIYIDDTETKNKIKLEKNKIRIIKQKFNPKAILILIDELSEIVNDKDYRCVSDIQNYLGSIARLGRAAGVHLCLATQRPSGNVINADLKNNIQMGMLLGDFDSAGSALVFDEDISDISKPEIKGRGYIKSGKEIIEFQSYWTEKEKDFQIKSEVKEKELNYLDNETIKIKNEIKENKIIEKKQELNIENEKQNNKVKDNVKAEEITKVKINEEDIDIIINADQTKKLNLKREEPEKKTLKLNRK